MKLLESFDHPVLDKKLQWFHEPTTWYMQKNQLHIMPDAETDFWQRTHYGFKADDGHFLYAEVHGDFTLEAQVLCDFRHQYDQAGLMVYISDQCWIKTAVEYEPDDFNKLGVVVTNHGYSDWSTQNVADDFTQYRLKIIRKGSDYTAQVYNAKLRQWIQLRMFHLFDKKEVKAGLYACSPKESGFSARFNYLKIE